MKKLFRTIKKKLSPLLLIPIAFVVIVLVGGYFIFFSGGDDNDKTAAVGPPSGSQAPPTTTGHEQGKLAKPKSPTKVAPARPTGTEFTIDSDRDEKDYALAQAIGSIKTPATIRVRIGAAPKQPVTVNWNIVCLMPSEGAKSIAGTFTVTPPSITALKLPVPAASAVSCTATANAQLTLAGKGRIKVFLLGRRRADT